ncbi:MAG: bile acid:sodium symporter [Opitutaceae bacterium]|nr:bile acid:sodium symporter [Opitutaceae bacterium]MBP9913640.1 bile acid:sodium symporter [Opitutaceae bacterium]
MKRGPDWFLIGMVVAVGLAWLWPEPGAHGGWLHPEILVKAGVALIFFLHGVLLSFAALKAGALRWPLHLVVQGCTFLFFPLLGLGLLALAGGWLAPDLRLGFFYLCALPSTVSSSVALTAAARGNVPAAVFNATLSSLLGVVLTPLWVGVLLKTGGQTLPLGEVILDLVKWLLLPLALGQASRPWLGAWAAGHKPLINTVDRGTILLLVYTSFCASVQQRVWSDHGWAVVLTVLAGSLLVFTIVMTSVRVVSNALGFAREDRIAAMFCGSKKTLASGVPMALLIFGAQPGLGLILLPIMIYHALQLVICSVLAGRWAKEVSA